MFPLKRFSFFIFLHINTIIFCLYIYYEMSHIFTKKYSRPRYRLQLLVIYFLIYFFLNVRLKQFKVNYLLRKI